MEKARLEQILNVHQIRFRHYNQDPCQLLQKYNMYTSTHLVFNAYDIAINDMSNSQYVNHTITCLTQILIQFTSRNITNIHFILLTSLPVATNSEDGLYLHISAVYQNTLETILRFYHINHGIPLTVIRLPNLFGTFATFSNPVIDLIDKYSKGHLYQDYLYPHQFKTGQVYSYIEDVRSAIVKVLYTAQRCSVVNIIPNQKHSISQIMEVLVSLELDISHHSHLSLLEYFHSAKSSPVIYFDPYSHVVKDILFYNQSMTLSDQVSETAKWYQGFDLVNHPSLGNDVIFSSYFTSGIDPQRQRHIKNNNFSYMKIWYFSMKMLSLKAVIFHDELSNEFTQKISSDQLKFFSTDLQCRSTNDARFYSYLKYLKSNTDIHRVFLTDISDVEFKKDPFELMDILGDFLYIGTDIDLFPTLASMGWLTKRLTDCFGAESNENGEIAYIKKLNIVYNAGVIGGTRDLIISFLERVTEMLDKTPHDVNCNMPVVNYVVHKYFDDKVYTGYPLTSRFMKRQEKPTEVYILHK